MIGLSMLIAGCGQAVDSRVEESIDAHGEIESYAAIESYNFLIEGEEPVNVEKHLSVYLEPLAWETSISNRREGTFYVFHYRFTEEERNYISIDQENWMEMEESSEEYEEIGFESYTTIFETQGVKPTELVSKVVENNLPVEVDDSGNQTLFTLRTEESEEIEVFEEYLLIEEVYDEYESATIETVEYREQLYYDSHLVERVDLTIEGVVEQDGEEIPFEQTLSNSFEGYNTIDPITQPENTIDRLW